MEQDKINILIIGDNCASFAIARKLSQNPNAGQIYITSSKDEDWEFFKKVDIRDDDITGLLVFALENNINLTIPASEKALESDVVSFFQSNGQNIFGGNKNSCKVFLNNLICKKFLYRIKAPVPKFGIYNKISQALDYLEHSSLPVIIQTAHNSPTGNDRLVCPTIKTAVNFLETLFNKGETDVLIENYTYGHNFTVYFITDGYCAIPLNVCANYKFLEGGLYFDGVGSYCPDYKIPREIIHQVCSIAQKLLQDLEAGSNPYMGIFGIECIFTNDGKLFVEDLKPFLQNHNASAVLNSLDDDIIKIMFSCINGFFSDEYENIKTNDLYSASLCVFSKYEGKEIRGIKDCEEIDFVNIDKSEDRYYTKEGLNFCITKSASTLGRAKELLQEELSEISFDGIEYCKKY